MQGRYSAILAGAAFMDSATLFPAYWSPELEPARALVDEVRRAMRPCMPVCMNQHRLLGCAIELGTSGPCGKGA